MTSSCPNCQGHSFELMNAEPSMSSFIYVFVQCSSCGAVVGVLDTMNIGAQIKKQNKAINAIADKVGAYVDL